MWPDKNLTVVAISLDEEASLKREKNRQFWVHNMLKKRNV